MTTDEFRKSLSDEQAKAFNAALVEMRDNVNAARDANEQTLAAAHAQEIGVVKDSLATASARIIEVTSAKDAAEKSLATKNAEVAAGIATIHEIVADPETDTEKGIIAFLHEATKDERTKQRDALEAQRAELDKQIASLA